MYFSTVQGQNGVPPLGELSWVDQARLEKSDTVWYKYASWLLVVNDQVQYIIVPFTIDNTPMWRSSNEATGASPNAERNCGLPAYWPRLTYTIGLILLGKGIHFLSTVWINQENGVRFASENHYGWQEAVCRQTRGRGFSWRTQKKNNTICMLTIVWKRPGVPYIFGPGGQCRMEKLGTVCCTPRFNREPSQIENDSIYR